MATTESRITAKGQISIPAAVRRKLALAPGSRIEWVERDGEFVVRRASRYSSEDMHAALFDQRPAPKSVDDMDNGIRRRLKGKHECR